MIYKNSKDLAMGNFKYYKITIFLNILFVYVCKYFANAIDLDCFSNYLCNEWVNSHLHQVFYIIFAHFINLINLISYGQQKLS